MSFISRVKDGFWSYISPRRTQERRDKPFKTPATAPPRIAGKKRAIAELDSASVRHSMSPASRVKKWRVRSPSKSQSPEYARNAPPTPSSLIASPPLSPGLDYRYGWSPSGGVDEDTYIDDDEEELFDANEETIVVTEDQLQENIFDIEAERERWRGKAEAQRQEGWSESAIEIYRKIGMRGYEPLLPSSWKIDFPTLPKELFSDDDEEVFINSVSGNNFRATRSLQKLLVLGSRIRDARDQRISSRGPQEAARRGIEAYVKWALLDGGVNSPPDIPILHIETGGKNLSPAVLHETMVIKMQQSGALLREVLRAPSTDDEEMDVIKDEPDSVVDSIEPPTEADYIRELPTLYGIIASHTIVALVAYNLSSPQPALHIVAVLDYGDVNYEVWNSLALASLCIHCRNEMIELKRHVQVEGSVLDEMTDPDA